jgi:hypothetical protein
MLFQRWPLDIQSLVNFALPALTPLTQCERDRARGE